jgi:hypothetical protein
MTTALANVDQYRAMDAAAEDPRTGSWSRTADLACRVSGPYSVGSQRPSAVAALSAVTEGPL